MAAGMALKLFFVANLLKLGSSFSRRITSAKGSTRSSGSTSSSTATLHVPRLSNDHVDHLLSKKYVVIPNFVSPSLVEELQLDVQTLRRQQYFNVAKIGQDTTNVLNTEIRVAETCFLGPSKLGNIPSTSRVELYNVLDTVRQDLQSCSKNCKLDAGLTELLYAYYPQGGFYRRHRDAIPNSASTLRKYSLLLYLNRCDWENADGGALRMHFDSGGDELPPGEKPHYEDVLPCGGTLVLFESDAIPHEVLDTREERIAVVGWYNRPVQLSDAVELADGAVSPVRLALLAIAAGLVTVGLVNILS